MLSLQGADRYSPSDVKEIIEMVRNSQYRQILMALGWNEKDLTIVDGAAEHNLNIREYTQIVDGGADYVGKKFAWESAGYYWNTSGCNDILDTGGNTDDITAVINKYDSQESYDNRREYYLSILEMYSQVFQE